MKGVKQLLRNKNFLKLTLASFTSKMGSMIGTTALLFYFLKEFSDKPFLATLTELMYSLPVLLLFFAIGVIADAYNRQKIAYYSDFISLILSIFLLLSVQTKILSFIFVLLLVRRMVQSFFEPAESALYQGILSEDEYTASAGINQFIFGFLDLAGKGMGIVIFWWLGVEGAIILDAISFLVSCLLIRSCAFEKEVVMPNESEGLRRLRFREIWTKYKEGIFYISKHPLLRSLMNIFVLFGVINACFSIVPVFLLKYELAPHNYEAVSVWDGVAVGFGYLVGGTCFTALSSKVKPYTLIIGGLMLTGLTTIGVGYSPNIIVFLLFTFAVTFCITSINVGMLSLLPMIVDSSVMGRVRGCILPVMTGAQVLSYGLITWLFPRYVTASLLFFVIGVLIVVIGVIYWTWFYMRNDNGQRNTLISEIEPLE